MTGALLVRKSALPTIQVGDQSSPTTATVPARIGVASRGMAGSPQTRPRAWLAVLTLPLLVTACGGPSPAPALPTVQPTASPGSSSAFVDYGLVLRPTDFGRPSGSIIGDPTGVLLPDGRIRLFIFVDTQGVWRAISTDSTGTAFTVEGACMLVPDTATNETPPAWGEPRVTPVTGGLRMFYLQDRGIASATSTDHIIWRQEPGLRITAAQAGVQGTTTGSVVALRTGGFRIYFSSLRDTPSDPATVMKSATSTDQINWTMDPGVRVGPGAPFLDQNATDPFAMANSDGSVTAWYFVQQAAGSSFQGTSGLYAATSTDGLEFRTSFPTGIPGGNPNVIVRADGVRMMYLSSTDPSSGPGIRAIRLQ